MALTTARRRELRQYKNLVIKIFEAHVDLIGSDWRRKLHPLETLDIESHENCPAARVTGLPWGKAMLALKVKVGAFGKEVRGFFAANAEEQGEVNELWRKEAQK